MKNALFVMFIFTMVFVGVLSSKASAICYSGGYCDNSYSSGYSMYNNYNNSWYGNNSNVWGGGYSTVWGSDYNSYGCGYSCYSYSQPYSYNYNSSPYYYNNYNSYNTTPYYGYAQYGYPSNYGYNGGLSINLGFVFIRR